MKDERNVKILEPMALIITISVISAIALGICGYSLVKDILRLGSISDNSEFTWKLIIKGVDILAMIVAVVFIILTFVQLKKFGTPFIAEVINGVNGTAFSIMVGGMVHMLLVGIYPMVIAMNSFNMADYGDYTYGCGAMLFGGIIMACAEMLKYGVRTAKPSEKPAEKDAEASEANDAPKDVKPEINDIVKEIKAAKKEAEKDENIE